MNGKLMNNNCSRSLPTLMSIFFVAVACFSNGPLLAQKWARDMFEVTQHDFEVVPRGAKTEYEFKFTNKYKETVHVSSVRTSCKCTIPRIGKNDLKTYEEGSIIAEFKTSDFVGARAAVITVVFDRPFYAELQLIVKGNIRSDILPEPGEIQFGEVDLGTEKVTDVKISYTGTAKWEINDVLSKNEHLAVKLSQPKTINSKIEYVMNVRLKNTAVAGEFADEIVLVTNEAQSNRVTLPVRANVVPPLHVESVQLGTLQVGGTKNERLLVKAKTPFKIEKIECADGRFIFTTPGEAKPVHLINFDFKADDKVGAFREKVIVHTSLPDSATAEAYITGNVTQ
jgi:Protein of unknown function (DUF1573)